MAHYFFDFKKHRGFTMIEFLIVVVLIAIVAVIAVPRWVTSPTLDAQTQQLLGDLRYAQMLAITHGQRFRVNFILSPSSYGITNLSGTVVPNPSTNTNTVTLGSGVTISGTTLPNSLVAFDENGIPYSDSAATIPLAADATITLSRNAMTRSILITQQTGNMAAQ